MQRGYTMSDEKKAQNDRAQNDRSTIFISKKGTMNYCLVAVTIFNKGAETCQIRARGRLISKAVDVAEITTRKFLPEMLEIAEVKIGSEEVENDGIKKSVSTIDITLKKK